jgi:hypothetical protein
MKSPLVAYLAVVAAGSLLAFAGCGDDDGSIQSNEGGSSSNVGMAGQPPATNGPLECQVLGELCHEADRGSGPAHDCHETGHQGAASTCVKDFSSCIHTCVTDATDLGAGGASPDPSCIALGELCHEVDDITGPLHDCHETGHIGDAAQCAATFDSCATQCLAARAALETSLGGAGGATSAGGAP